MSTIQDDPASRVPPALLQHLHLVAQYAYPLVQTTSLDFILERLIEASRIVRDLCPMSWTFLDFPQDGTVFLVYQSPNTQNRFASDGYVWGDPEQYFRQEYHGYLIEMFIHQYGYNPLKESAQGPAGHSRRRYRLVQNPSSPTYNCNPDLWIVHYGRAPQMFPASRVPIGPQEHQSIQQRKWLQTQGRLVDNKFALADRNNWPNITMPNQHGGMRGPGPTIGFTGGAMAQPVARQQMAQPGHVYSAEQPPSKRARHSNIAARAPGLQVPRPAQAVDLVELEEEEYKDLHDYLTQRDISQMRYMQHHEWMEELYSSYPTFAIKPVSLGLGRKGELEPLTSGFFDPPRPPTPPGKSSDEDDAHYDSTIQKPLEPGKAEEFYTRAMNKIAEVKNEMERMKLDHAKQMEGFARIRQLREAEKSLRSAVTAAAGNDGVNIESAKIDGGMTQLHDPARGDATIAVLRQMEHIDIVAKKVEELLGLKVGKRANVKLLQRGGLTEESVPAAGSKGPGVAGLNGDIASIFDDFLEPGAGERSLLNSEQQSAKLSASPQPLHDSDHPMAGQRDAAADDWVMVNKQDTQPQAASTANGASTTNMAPAPPTITAPSGPPPATDSLQAGASTEMDMNDAGLGDDLVDFGNDDEPNDEAGFDDGAFNDAIDFGNIGTAGVGMDDFVVDGGDDGGGVHVGLGMDAAAGNDGSADVGASTGAEQGPGLGGGGAATGAGHAQVLQQQGPVPPVPEAAVSAGGEQVQQGGNTMDDAGAMDDVMEDSAFGDAFHHTENEAREG